MNISGSLSKIISGGQTGVDRAALDVAIELNIPHAGWCPAGRLAEDGKINNNYNLKETSGKDYLTRTTYNVRDSDATLILNCGMLEGGTAATVKIARELNKPYLIIDLEKPLDNFTFNDWLCNNNINILNIAGPRESKRPGVYRLASDFLHLLLSDCNVKLQG